MKYFFTTILCLAFFSTCYAQSNFTVQLQGSVNLIGKPYQVSVIDHVTLAQDDRQLNNSGTYPFTANVGDFFVITNISDHSRLLTIPLTAAMVGTIYQVGFVDNYVPVINKLGSAVSSKNYWIGASVAYNVQGESSNDIVGGTKIIINPHEIFNDDRQHLNVIGNIGTFFANTSKDDNKAALSKLSQSQTGLSVGLGYQFDLRANTTPKGGAVAAAPAKKTPGFVNTLEITSGYRLNSFKDPKVDTNTIGLSQLRTAVLYEMSVTKWGKGGYLTLGFEGSVSLFSSSTYEQIFGAKKGTRFAFETTMIVPISENIGFMANLISAQNMKPVYQFGFTIKTAQ